MKGIKKTLMAGVLACATFNAQAEVSPWSYGAKVGPSICPYVMHDKDAKIGGKEVEHKFFDNLFVSGGLYGEYAFTDYFGMGLEAIYMKQGATLTKMEEEKEGDASNSTKSSINMASHGVALPIYLSIYLLGRGDEEGILKLTLGAAPYLPFSTSYSKDGQELTNLTEDQKKERPRFDIPVHVGLGYEFPFGLAIEAVGHVGLMNRFNTEKNKSQTIFHQGVQIKELKPTHVAINIGYNFASLLSE